METLAQFLLCQSVNAYGQFDAALGHSLFRGPAEHASWSPALVGHELFSPDYDVMQIGLDGH